MTSARKHFLRHLRSLRGSLFLSAALLLFCNAELLHFFFDNREDICYFYSNFYRIGFWRANF
jgi:hypothetical protein